MPPPGKRRRWFKWVMLTVAVLLAAIWAVSEWRWSSWKPTSGFAISVWDGGIRVMGFRAAGMLGDSSDQLIVTKTTFADGTRVTKFNSGWLPYWRRKPTYNPAFSGSYLDANVPLWIPIAMLGAGFAWSWRRDRVKPGCPTCHYPLTGLPPNSPCPECGTVPAAPVAAINESGPA